MPYLSQEYSVLTTHGGLNSLPKNLAFVGTDQMINRVGKLKDTDTVSASFNKNTNKNTYQVHGHRNL